MMILKRLLLVIYTPLYFILAPTISALLALIIWILTGKNLIKVFVEDLDPWKLHKRYILGKYDHG